MEEVGNGKKYPDIDFKNTNDKCCSRLFLNVLVEWRPLQGKITNKHNKNCSKKIFNNFN